MQPTENKSAGLKQTIVNRLTLIGNVRDGILVSGAIFYAAGYLVWSIHAWRNNMGVLPVLDFQYFIAGFTPVLILTISYFTGRGFWHLIMRVTPGKLGSNSTGGWKYLRRLLIVLFGFSLFSFVFMAHPSLAIVGGLLWLLSTQKYWPEKFKFKHYEKLGKAGKRFRIISLLIVFGFIIAIVTKGDVINTSLFGFVKSLEDTLTPIAVFLIFITILFLPMPEKDWISRSLKVLYFSLTILLFPFIGLTYYTLEIYPNWPQELGGVQPRCAYIDAAPKTLSAETRAILFSEQVSNESDEITRSKKLSVLFSSDAYILVKPVDVTSQNDVYELKKSELKAISWCN